jgi:hypothetical protein
MPIAQRNRGGSPFRVYYACCTSLGNAADCFPASSLRARCGLVIYESFAIAVCNCRYREVVSLLSLNLSMVLGIICQS